MIFKFSLKYFLLTVLLFVVEVIIATYLKDIFWIRAYFGDVVVVWLLYTFVLSFFDVKDKPKLVLGILLFSFAVEIAQYFNIADKLGFERGSMMHIIIGNSFSWLDMACYLAGATVLWTILFFKKIFNPSYMERSEY